MALNNPRRTPIPLRPDPSAVNEDAMRSLIKATIIAGKGAINRSTWASAEGDRITELVLRAAVPPLSTADAAALVTVAVAFVDALRPMSAAARLISRSLRLAWNAGGVVSVPNMALPLANFVGQGQPIPTVIGHTTAALLEPFKLAVITSLTSEMLTSEMLQNPAVEAIIRQVLIENCGPSAAWRVDCIIVPCIKKNISFGVLDKKHRVVRTACQGDRP
jgi:hypothetical protein